MVRKIWCDCGRDGLSLACWRAPWRRCRILMDCRAAWRMPEDAAPALAGSGEEQLECSGSDRRPSGDLIYYEKLDNTQLGSANVAMTRHDRGTF